MKTNDFDFILVPIISPFRESRALARKALGSNFIELYVKCSIESCIKRDVKGHYKQALKGRIKNFTGIGADFTAPKSFKLKIDTSKLNIHDSVAEIAKLIDT